MKIFTRRDKDSVITVYNIQISDITQLISRREKKRHTRHSTFGWFRLNELISRDECSFAYPDDSMYVHCFYLRSGPINKYNEMTICVIATFIVFQLRRDKIMRVKCTMVCVKAVRAWLFVQVSVGFNNLESVNHFHRMERIST